MAKPYRYRTLINLFLMVVIILSGILTVTVLLFLRGARVLPHAFFTTLWMPIATVLVINLMAAVVNYFLVPRIVRPIESLIDATKKVAKGDFSVRIPSEKQIGEMKELVESFNAMAGELGGTEIFRSDFIRDFSHEFKTPIVSMSGFAKELKNPDLTPKERNEYCDIIIQESHRLINMSQNILLLSRFENQNIISDKTRFRLDEQLRSCILLQEKEWEEKKLTIEMDVEEVTISQNADVLCHVWNNLISNAIKFTPPEGTLTLRATSNDDTAMVVIKDTGIGMTEEEMKHIFDKCYQADPSHSGSGNGLGLCIVKRIVTLCGGQITVRSKKGQGSVFTVTLPRQ